MTKDKIEMAFELIEKTIQHAWPYDPERKEALKTIREAALQDHKEVDVDYIPMPPNKEYAEKMLLVAERWLKDQGHLSTAPEWQDISTAPKDGTEIILLLDDGKICGGSWGEIFKWTGAIIESWCFDWSSHEKPIPTHWMPLPPPPKDGGEDDGYNPVPFDKEKFRKALEDEY